VIRGREGGREGRGTDGGREEGRIEWGWGPIAEGGGLEARDGFVAFAEWEAHVEHAAT
jgi:hypothetical protein